MPQDKPEEKKTIKVPKTEKKEPKSTGKLPHVTTSDKSLRIPRNVTYYAHFLEHPYITEKDIEWVLKLRNTDSDTQEMQARLARIPNQAFSLADRKDKDKEEPHCVTDIKHRGNTVQVLHLLRHRIGPTAPQGQVQFEAGLRSYADADKDLREKERKWTTVPKKDKHDFPEFLPKYQEEATLKKEMKESGKLKKITYTGRYVVKFYFIGFDGDQQYPSYTMKFKQRNLQDIKHLFHAGQKMSCVQWEEGLRELKPIKKAKEDSPDDKNKKPKTK